MSFLRIKNWVMNTGFWSILVFCVIIGIAVASESWDNKNDLAIATKILKGERVEAFEVIRIRNMQGSIVFEGIKKDLLEAGFTEADIDRIYGDELRYMQLSPRKQ